MRKVKINMWRGCSQDQRGFTLIEFLIYSVIVSFVIGALVLTGVNVLQGRGKVGMIEEVNHNGRVVMERMTYYIRHAKKINSPNIGESASSLSLEMPIKEKSPTVFSVNVNGFLVVEIGSTGFPLPLTSENITVTSLNFINVSYPSSPGAIRIEITIKYNDPGNREEYSFEKTFYTTENIRAMGYLAL